MRSSTSVKHSPTVWPVREVLLELANILQPPFPPPHGNEGDGFWFCEASPCLLRISGYSIIG